jgi:hypothetical protein
MTAWMALRRSSSSISEKSGKAFFSKILFCRSVGEIKSKISYFIVFFSTSIWEAIVCCVQFFSWVIAYVVCFEPASFASGQFRRPPSPGSEIIFFLVMIFEIHSKYYFVHLTAYLFSIYIGWNKECWSR